MYNENSSLPQIRRIKSGDIKGEWMRMTNSRRISIDMIRSSTAETNLNRIKDKAIQRIQKTSLVNDSFVHQSNRTTNSNNNRIRAKSSTGRILINAANAVPVFGDHKTILEGSQMLEMISKLEANGSLDKYNRTEMNYLFLKKAELQNLLKEKCKFTIKEDCLTHIINANALIQELRGLYVEDNSKFNLLKNIKSEDRRKSKALDSFVKNCKVRKLLPEDIDQRSSSWISLITNTNRLISVTHLFPNDDGLDLIIQKTVEELKDFRLYSSYLVRIILQINIELMSLLIDSLPFECISDICISGQNFNKFLTSEQIEPLDLVSVVATYQAKVATNKFLYYLYNETNKNIDLIMKNETNSVQKQLKLEEITSDYFSASSQSTALIQTRKHTIFNSKIQKDLKTVFNILIQSNQRILLKIIFGHQENTGNNQTKSSGSRQKWFKIEANSVEQQQSLCQEYDKLFWNKFWTEFNKMIESSLCFANSDNTSVPISALYNETKATLISNILENCIRDEELLLEAVKSLELAQYNLLLRRAFQKWSENQITLTSLIEKSTLTVVDNEDENRIGTLVGITLYNAVEPLLAIRVKYSGYSNTIETIIDNLLINTLNKFVCYVESRQSAQIDPQFLTSYIALSILDINNLNELLSNLDLKWINSLAESLNCIKKNAFIKVKLNMYSNSYELITKTIPFKEYKKKMCSTKSDWIENAISILLEPDTAFLTKDSSFDANTLVSNLIEEFAKALLDCIYKDNKIKLKFSYSGAIQFNKDIEFFWDWIVRNSLRSTNLSAITQLKSISFSLINRDKSIAKRYNRVSPTISFIHTNEMINSQTIQQNMRINDRSHRNCFTFLCPRFFQFYT